MQHHRLQEYDNTVKGGYEIVKQVGFTRWVKYVDKGADKRKRSAGFVSGILILLCAFSAGASENVVDNPPDTEISAFELISGATDDYETTETEEELLSSGEVPVLCSPEADSDLEIFLENPDAFLIRDPDEILSENPEEAEMAEATENNPHRFTRDIYRRFHQMTPAGDNNTTLADFEEKVNVHTNVAESAWKKMADFSINRGKPQEDGGYLYYHTTTGIIYGFEYNPKEDVIAFFYDSLTIKDGEKIEKMCTVYLKHSDPDNAVVYYDYIVDENTKWYIATADFSDTNSYTGSTNIVFRRDDSEGMNYSNTDLQNDANSYLKFAMKEWQSDICWQAGTLLNQLHFHSYGHKSSSKTHVFEQKTVQATFNFDGWTGKECSYCNEQKLEKIVLHPETIRLSAEAFVYNGKNQKPEVTLLQADGKPFPAEMYTITYSSDPSINPGRYQVTVKLTGNAVGTKRFEYIIDYGTPQLKSVFNEHKGIRLKWNKIENATGYCIYRKFEGDEYWNNIQTITDGSAESFLDTSVEQKSGTVYYYSIVAKHKGFYSSYNKTGSRILRLSTPLTTHAFNVTAGINVRWSPVKGAASYRIYRRTKDTGYTLIGYVTGENNLNYKDETARNGEEYIYTVRAAKKGVLSDYYRNGKMAVRLPISRVYRLDNNLAGIGIKWADVGYVEGYMILRKEGDSWKEIASVPGNISYYTDTSVKNSFGTIYTYSVRGYTHTSRNENCLAAYSTIGKNLYRLKRVNLQSVKKSGTGNAVITWEKMPLYSGFQIEYADNGKFENVKTITVSDKNASSYLVKKLPGGKTCYFRVRTYLQAGSLFYFGVYSTTKMINM